MTRKQSAQVKQPSTSKMSGIRWLPLESNPEVINKYVSSLGAGDGLTFSDVYDLSESGLQGIPRPVLGLLMLYPIENKVDRFKFKFLKLVQAALYVTSLGLTTDKWNFTDIYGLDPELLILVPRPVAAVMLLYPIGEKSESQPFGKVARKDNLYFLKQTIGNACGTIGLLHALINNREQLSIPAGAHLNKFYEATKDMSPAERATYMESDETLGSAHEDSANEGQTKYVKDCWTRMCFLLPEPRLSEARASGKEQLSIICTLAPSRDDKINFHFICFIHKDGSLYELDGRKEGPVKHGNTSADTLLEDACQIVKKFMERDPESLNFTMIALSKV